MHLLSLQNMREIITIVTLLPKPFRELHTVYSIKMDSWQKFMDDEDEEKKIITTVGRPIIRFFYTYLID